jgi:hypothetical protein
MVASNLYVIVERTQASTATKQMQIDTGHLVKALLDHIPHYRMGVLG